MKRFLYILSGIILLLAIVVGAGYCYVRQVYEGDEKRIFVADGIEAGGLEKLLADSLGEGYGEAVYNIWKLRNGSIKMAHGSYLVKPGESVAGVARRLRGGMQDPVKVVIPNVRKLDKVLDIMASYFEFNKDELSRAIVTKAREEGLNDENVIAMLIPDTYEFYWTSSPETVANRLSAGWNRFWNASRRAKAGKLGLTPVEVSIVASIVEEESNKRSEHPTIGRLYLNRLARGMKLQADPTVKYAVGDPTLRRILNKHLAVESPYNTYIHEGLPPGPIRMVDASTLDAVLNAGPHDYLYMCAKEDFSGYHNFARTLGEHNANTARYHEALRRLKM